MMEGNSMPHGFACKNSTQKRQRDDEDETSDRSKANETFADKKNKSNGGTGANSDDFTKCSICLDTVNTSVMKSLPCAHVFHEECINDWLKISDVCPICRWPIIADGSDSSIMGADRSMEAFGNSEDEYNESIDPELGERNYDSELGEWNYDSELGERNYDSELGERNYDSELVGWNYDSELGGWYYDSDLNEWSNNSELEQTIDDRDDGNDSPIDLDADESRETIEISEDEYVESADPELGGGTADLDIQEMSYDLDLEESIEESESEETTNESESEESTEESKREESADEFESEESSDESESEESTDESESDG